MLIPVFLPLGSMKAVVLMAEGATCGKDGRRLCLPTSVLLIASPTSTGNIYVPFWASTKEQKDYMGHRWTSILSGPPAPGCGSRLPPGCGSSWQRWPGMSPGWILWVAEGEALMNSHQQLG